MRAGEHSQCLSNFIQTRSVNERMLPRQSCRYIPQSEHTMNIFYIIGVVVVIVVVAGFLGVHL